MLGREALPSSFMQFHSGLQSGYMRTSLTLADIGMRAATLLSQSGALVDASKIESPYHKLGPKIWNPRPVISCKPQPGNPEP